MISRMDVIAAAVVDQRARGEVRLALEVPEERREDARRGSRASPSSRT